MAEITERTNGEEIAKLRIKYSFLKFVIGTIGVSVLSMGINWQIQEKKLEYEMRAKESDFIAQFLDRGLENELEKRRDFAEYFVRLSPSQDARQRWQDYLSFVKELITKANVVQKLLEEKDKQLAAALDRTEAAQEKVKKALEDERKAREEVERLSKIATESADDKAVIDKLQEEIKIASTEALKLQVKLEDESAIAESSQKELEEVRTEVATRRMELASLRSRPLLEDSLPITADNVAVKSKVSEKTWDWTVFIQGPDYILDQVEYVEYTLHPTFPNPVRVVSNRGSGPYAFPNSTSGWGTFPIRIRVCLKNGRVQNLTHNLSFDESKSPRKASGEDTQAASPYD